MTGARISTPPPPGPATSPCVNLCRMDADSGWCLGCWRTLDEIVAWGRSSDAARRLVLAQLPARRAAVPPRSGAA